MKRDMNLIREIMLKLESCEEDTIRYDFLEGFEREQLDYHLELMNEANLIDAPPHRVVGGTFFTNIKITWDGHEFLDAARDERIWKKTAARIREGVLSAPYPILLRLLTSAAEKTLGL